MAGKFWKKTLKVLSIAFAVVAVLSVVLQVALNSHYVRSVVDGAVRESMDAELEYSDLRFSFIRSFPRIRVSMDEVSVTYSHDRFSSFDSKGVKSRLLSAGRGSEMDTLMSLQSFTAAVNIWKIFIGRIALSDASVSGLRLYAHKYDSLSANWNVFRPGDSPEEVPDSLSSEGLPLLPWVSVGKVRIGDSSGIIYTSQSDTVYAALRFSELSFGGEVLPPHGKRGVRFRKLSFSLDSLAVFGRLPADTLLFRMDRLTVSNPRRQTLDIGIGALASMRTGAFGRLQIPFEMGTRVFYDSRSGKTFLSLEKLEGSAAYIPFEGTASSEIYPDSIYVRASFAIPDCDLGKVFDEYAHSVYEKASDISTDARLDVSLDIDGSITESSVPEVSLSVKLPKSHLSYKPMDVLASLALDFSAHMTSDGDLSASIARAGARMDGLSLDLRGSASDLLGEDPAFRFEADGYFKLDSLVRFAPEGMDLSANGEIKASLAARASKSELTSYEFEKSSVSGKLSSRGIIVEMPSDTLKAVLGAPSVLLSAGKSGLMLNADMDSLVFSSGSSLFVKIRDTRNSFAISKVLKDSRLVPNVEIKTGNKGVFMKSGDSKLGMRDVNLMAGARRRTFNRERRKRFLDSLQRVYPGVPRDSLFAHMRLEHMKGKLPDFLSEKDFAAKDIDIRLDSSLVKYLREWVPSGSVSVSRGFFSSPAFPLRTRLTGLDGSFDDDSIVIKKIAVTSGTSDMQLSGRLKGLRRSLQRKGRLKLDLDLSSNRINANEILVAMQMGQTDSLKASISAEDEGSFVVDSISGAKFAKEESPLLVVPANLNATVNLRAERVDYSDVQINPMTARLKMAERCLQLTDTDINTNLGRITLDAFYSTRTKQDISVGFNMGLHDMSAEGIIHTIPSVDEMLPMIKSFKGKLGMELAATAKLDTNMNVLMPSVDGLVRISGENLRVEDAGELRKITGLLLFKDRNIGDIRDLYVDAVVHDGRIRVYPFVLGVDRYTMALMGWQNLSGKMRYNVSVLKSPVPFKFGINIYGTPEKMRFSLGKAKYRSGKVPVYTEQLDTMQVNILESIRNIYRSGVDNAMEAQKRTVQDALKGVDALDWEEVEVLSMKEFMQLEAMAAEADFAELDEQTAKEIEEILSGQG